MHPAAYTVSKSQKVGDGLVFFLKIVVYTPGIALILFTLMIVAGMAIGDPKQGMPNLSVLYLIALAPSLPAAIAIACRSLQWQVELDEEGLRLMRPCFASRVAYRDVVFLRLGTVVDQLQGQDGQQPRNPRLLIEYRPHGKFAIWLASPDAERLFTTLRERCDHAAVIDAAGTEHAPRRDRDNGGVRLLSRKRLISGSALIAAGLLTLVLAVFGKNTAGSGDSLEYIRREAIRWLGIIQAPVLIGVGLSILRRRPAGKEAVRREKLSQAAS